MIFFTKKIIKYKNVLNTVELDYNTRSKNRVKITFNGNKEAMLALKNRKIVRGGDILSDDLEKEIIQIIAAKEKLSLVSSNNNFLMLKACYHLGNRHILLQIKENKVSYYRDHVIDNMIINLGLQVNHIFESFDPENGAYKAE